MEAFAFRTMDEAGARAILAWHYEPPYDIYNLDAGPPEEAMRCLLDPQNAYYQVEEAGELVAYCCFGPDARVPDGADQMGGSSSYPPGALDIGLGVRPDLTGRGRGLQFASAVLDFARRAFAPAVFRVTVAAFNERALRIWYRAGFQPVRTFARHPDGLSFVVLEGRAQAMGGSHP